MLENFTPSDLDVARFEYLTQNFRVATSHTPTINRLARGCYY